MKKISIIALTCLSLSASAQTKRMTISGTKVSLIPPDHFEASTTFTPGAV